MSRPRICDRCNSVFSELEDGWQAFTATTVKKDENGKPVEIVQAMDACPSCALAPTRVFTKELRANQADNELQERIARLERETGVAQPDVKAPTRAGDTLG